MIWKKAFFKKKNINGLNLTLTLSSSLVYRDARLVSHETKHRENDKTSKQAGSTVDEGHQHGIPERENRSKEMKKQSNYLF